MARVNRTTGFFLVLGVIVLIGSVAGALYYSPSKEVALSQDESRAPDVFCGGKVDIATRVSTPVPGMTGVIAAVDVKEGDVVKAGQPLYRLDDTLARSKVEAAELALRIAKEQYAMAKLTAEEYKAKVTFQKGAIKIAKSTWAQASALYKKKQELQKSVGGGDADVVIAGLDMAKAFDLQDIEERKLQDMERLSPSVHITTLADLNCQAEDLALKSAKQALALYVVKAPRDGSILEIHISPGDPFPPMPTAMQSRPIIVFLPDEPLIVRADVPQSLCRGLKRGMRVTLRDHDPSTSDTWDGIVESLSSWVIRPRSILLEPDQINDARFRECVIRIIGKPADFPVMGSQMRVQFHLEHP